ncbi:MAG: gliding motility-associated C-terminal domain-containing protein [Cyclobacteriaceae bacterium]|nr:gliding motility-associated C-terminal domain-containing protein [Cyclobacteriaceae bacterium]MDH5249186.1 gliding motility-associated C-terminal domain-containing protein [Cyclobacteriaceae bacterium]
MIVRFLVVLFLLSFSLELSGQDNIGAGHAISFDGIDDYIDLGNIYDDLELPLTISAWIFLDPGGLGTIFSSQDNTHLYNGFHFFVVHTAVIIEYGDGMGTFTPDFRRGKAGPVDNIFGKWVHLTAIMRGATDMDLFLNGVNIGGTYIGNSQLPMNSAFPEDAAKIGYRSGVGVTYHFQGIMDELRIWNRSLSESEIREQMCKKLTGKEPGLIGYWDFDNTAGNTLIDKSPNHFDGQVMGSPKRVFSGAPIGDESIVLYTNDWQDKELVWKDSLDYVRVGNVKGDPNSLHIYKINSLPSQGTGLNLSTVAAPYFGVFAASVDANSSFDVDYTYNDSAICRLFTRSDNTVSAWTASPSALVEVDERVELIKEKWGSGLHVDLGPDEELCVFRPRSLDPLSDTTNFDFLWQDGSTRSSFQVTGFGTYWFTADNGCTQATDTLIISNAAVENLIVPNVFTPNGDLLNQFFEIDPRILGSRLIVYDRWGKEVYQSPNYQNDWDGAGLTAGVYFYTVKGGDCPEERKGSLSILR